VRVTPAISVPCFPNAALKSGGEGLVGEGGTNDGRKNFMHVGEPLDGIGEGLLVDLRLPQRAQTVFLGFADSSACSYRRPSVASRV
jgi:hypothetical protein